MSLGVQRLGAFPPHDRPTEPVDLSETVAGASDVGGPERALFWAYRNTTVDSVPCVCGGSIRRSASDGAQAHAIRAHNRTRLHECWRLAAGIA